MGVVNIMFSSQHSSSSSSSLLLATLLVATVISDGPPPPYSQTVQEPPQPYSYQYGVKDEYSGANFGASESSDPKVVSGTYTVVLPDGRVQTVKYTADDYAGYVADVSYQGEAVYPDVKPYKPAPPKYPAA